MAERLAPLTIAAPIFSRPEQTRRHRWRWPRRVIVLFVVLALALGGAVFTAHFLSIERHAHEIRATSLVPLGMPARVLVVVARPSQELPMAGALAALHEAGTSISLLALTADPATEPGPADVAGVDAAWSKPPTDAVTPPALDSAAHTLGLDSVAVAGFVPGDLMLADPGVVTQRISQAIRAQRPSAIVTVSDTTGADRDSQAVAGYTIAAASAPLAGVARVWTVSRGAWERGWQGFAGTARTDRRAPTPQVAVRLVGDIAGVKSAAMLNYADHGAGQSVSALYPAWNRLPSTLFLRFWDREYFALAWGTPLS